MVGGSTSSYNRGENQNSNSACLPSVVTQFLRPVMIARQYAWELGLLDLAFNAGSTHSLRSALNQVMAKAKRQCTTSDASRMHRVDMVEKLEVHVCLLRAAVASRRVD